MKEITTWVRTHIHTKIKVKYKRTSRRKKKNEKKNEINDFVEHTHKPENKKVQKKTQHKKTKNEQTSKQNKNQKKNTHSESKTAFKNTIISRAESYVCTIGHPSIIQLPPSGGGNANISINTEERAHKRPRYTRKMRFSACKMRLPSSNQSSGTLIKVSSSSALTLAAAGCERVGEVMNVVRKKWRENV